MYVYMYVCIYVCMYVCIRGLYSEVTDQVAESIPIFCCSCCTCCCCRCSCCYSCSYCCSHCSCRCSCCYSCCSYCCCHCSCRCCSCCSCCCHCSCCHCSCSCCSCCSCRRCSYCYRCSFCCCFVILVVLCTGPDLVTTGIAPAPPASISVISPINTSQMGGYSSITPNLRTTLASPHPPMIASLSNNTHAPSNPAPLPPGQYAYGRNPLKFVTSPPSSILDGPPIKYTMAASLMNDSTTSLSNQQQGHLLHSEHPSETSLISEKGSKYRCIIKKW